MERFVVDNKASTRKLARWLRTVFCDDSGMVYMPVGAFGDERSILLCLAFDGVSCVQHEGHIYAPVGWLEDEYPQHSEVIQAAVAMLQKHTEATKCA